MQSLMFPAFQLCLACKCVCLDRRSGCLSLKALDCVFTWEVLSTSVQFNAVEMDGDRAEAQSAPTAGARNEARPANLPPGKKKREPSLGARPLLPPIADNSSTLEVCSGAV